MQPWARKARPGAPSIEIELRYEMEVEEIPDGPLTLALEDPTRFEVRLNDRVQATENVCGWWVDPAVQLLPLDTAAVRLGKNILTLRGVFTEDADLEAMFILGDFNVTLDGTRTRIRKAQAPGFGDWTTKGLPFYAGSVAFRRTIEPHPQDGGRVFVEVPDFRGACVRVLVDGEQAGIIGWSPHEVEITGLLSGKASAELTVDVVSHRRNAFGPLHHMQKWPRWTGPGEFSPPADKWQDEYNLVPVGCLGPPRPRYRKMG